jgi:thiol-disulfide isomerase/thioredoxin
MKSAPQGQGLLFVDTDRRRHLGALAAGALCLSTSAVQATGARPARLPERPAPAIDSALNLPVTRLLDAGEVGADHWRGKVLLIELWATWCPFCRKQNPLLDRLVRANASRGLAMLGLYIDERDDDVRRYMREAGYGFSVARYDASWWSVLGRPKGLPIVWVVSREGRLLQVEAGEMFPEDINDLTRWL